MNTRSAILVVLVTVGLYACGAGPAGTANATPNANVSQNGAIHSQSATDTENAKAAGSSSPTQSGPGVQVTNFGNASPPTVVSGAQNNNNGPGVQNNNSGSGTQTINTGPVTQLATPAPPDPCAGYRIRNAGALTWCLSNCDQSRDTGLKSTGENGSGAAGVRNQHKSCTDGCNGSAHDSQIANCWNK